MSDALQKLCKWRQILAGWHGGTKGMKDAGVQALRDEAEHRLLVRAELNTVLMMLITKGVFTVEEFTKALDSEAALHDADMQRKFPGFETTLEGVTITDSETANATMKRLGFPP
jgi:hypothetical protein